MSTDQVRADVAAALRDLNHAFAAHDPDDEQLRDLTVAVRGRLAAIETTERRDRLALMLASAGSGSFPSTTAGSGFSDRAVGGSTNPTSVDVEIEFEETGVVARVVLRRAFEGAPGRGTRRHRRRGIRRRDRLRDRPDT